MTFQRGTARKIVALAARAQARGHALSSAATIPAWPPRSTRSRRGASTSSCAARATSPSASSCARSSGAGPDERRRALCVRKGATFVRTAGPAGEQSDRRRSRAAQSRGPRSRRLHLHRPADRRRRNLARLHLRLQLLLDHRDARPELPHLVDRACSRRHRRRARARRARHLHRRRQHHAERHRVSSALCRAIVAAGFHDIDYLVQAMTSSIAARGETLAPLMRAAGFRYVFLGIENVLDEDLAFLRARAKNAAARGRPHGRQCDGHGDRDPAPARDVRRRRPDRRQSRATPASRSKPTWRSRARYVDWPYIQHPTPYPGTPMTRDFRERQLIVSDDVDEYDGTTAVVRSEHLDAAGDRVHALAGRALDEAAPPLAGAGAQPAGSSLRHGHEMLGAYVPRPVVALAPGTRSERDVFARIKKNLGVVEREVCLGRRAPIDGSPRSVRVHCGSDRFSPWPLHSSLAQHAGLFISITTSPMTRISRARAACSRRGCRIWAPYLQGHDEVGPRAAVRQSGAESRLRLQPCRGRPRVRRGGAARSRAAPWPTGAGAGARPEHQRGDGA